MTEKLICPKCKRPSYTAAPDEPTPCPYCGFIFSKSDKGNDPPLYPLQGGDKGVGRG